jgi:hypothetical protein
MNLRSKFVSSDCFDRSGDLPHGQLIQSEKKPPDMPVFADRESIAYASVLAALGEAPGES